MAARRVTHIGRPASIALGAALMALFAALLLPGTALAVAKPGKPTAKAPTGTISTAKPTFKWSKAARATSYKVRVYEGSTLLVKKTGITGLSWKSSTALPKNVDLTWKVRARNAAGNGAWSRSLKFKIVTGFPAIGSAYQGGKVAYILQPGDRGYVAGQTHGLIADTDYSTSYHPIQWATEPYWFTSVPGALGTAIGTGAANTNAIIAQNGAGATYAAGEARAYTGGGYSDWFLPSRGELNKLYLNRVAIGGFGTTTGHDFYWSSSENESYVANAWGQYFGVGNQNYYGKYNANGVRAVRAF